MSTIVNEEQLAAVKKWVAEGVDLNGIQKKLQSEYGLHLTYMDVRFLLLDHGIELASEKPSPDVAANDPQSESKEHLSEGGEGNVSGTVRVELDDLQLPGTLISGKAHFPGGAEGAWQIDQLGRFGWSKLNGTPSPEEMKSFEQELTAMLRRS